MEQAALDDFSCQLVANQSVILVIVLAKGLELEGLNRSHQRMCWDCLLVGK